MTDSQLVHVVEWLPALSIYIEQVDLTISICVLTTDQEDLRVGNRKGRAGPKRVLHPNGEHLPLVLLDLVHLNGVIDFLLR